MIDASTDQFAVFYMLAILVATFAAVCVQLFLTRIGCSSKATALNLPVPQTAYLAGGSRRVIHAALASLAQRDAVCVIGGIIGCKNPALASNATLPEREILALLAISPLSPRKICHRCKVWSKGIKYQLQELGLSPSDSQLRNSRVAAMAVATLPAIAGVIRLIHRLPQHRPVVLLGFLCMVPTVLGMLMAMIPVYANACGIRLLNSLRKNEPYLKDIGYRKSLALTPDQVGRAVALNGARSLRESHLARLADLLDPPASGFDGSGGDVHIGDGGGHLGGFGDAF